MMWLGIKLALQVIGHLFSQRGPVLVFFWLATAMGLVFPSPLAAALGLHLVMRMTKNIARLRQTGQAIPWPVRILLVTGPIAVLIASDGYLMVIWSLFTASCCLMMWWWKALRDLQELVHPSPIDETDLWLEVRAATLLATGALGLCLSLANDSAIWITMVYLGAAGLDLTGMIYLRARGRI